MTKWVKWTDETKTSLKIFDGVRHPRNIVTLWPDADFRSIGMMNLVDANTPPGVFLPVRVNMELASEIHEPWTTVPVNPPPLDLQVKLDAATAVSTTVVRGMIVGSSI